MIPSQTTDMNPVCMLVKNGFVFIKYNTNFHNKIGRVMAPLGHPPWWDDSSTQKKQRPSVLKWEEEEKIPSQLHVVVRFTQERRQWHKRIEIGTHWSHSNLNEAHFYAYVFLMNRKFKHKAENLQAWLSANRHKFLIKIQSQPYWHSFRMFVHPFWSKLQ